MVTPRRTTSMKAERLVVDSSTADPAVMVAGGADALGSIISAITAGRPDWHTDAACRGTTVDFTSKAPDQRAAAFDLCGRCPVRLECRQWADDIDDRHSILAGEDPPARRARQKITRTTTNKESKP